MARYGNGLGTLGSYDDPEIYTRGFDSSRHVGERRRAARLPLRSRHGGAREERIPR